MRELKPKTLYLLPANFSFKIRYSKSFLHYWHLHILDGNGATLTDGLADLIECRDHALDKTFTEKTAPGSVIGETPLVFDFLCRMLGAPLAEMLRAKSPGRFDSLRARLAKNFQEPLDVGALARELSLSREHLSRRFAAECGATLKDYHIALRMEEAKRLLSLGDVSAQTVAERLGFSDAAHFGRIFKSKVGHSPKRYARLHRQSRS